MRSLSPPKEKNTSGGFMSRRIDSEVSQDRSSLENVSQAQRRQSADRRQQEALMNQIVSDDYHNKINAQASAAYQTRTMEGK